MRDNLRAIIVCTLLVTIVGCQSESDRVAEVAHEAAQRQAEQSKQMVQLQNQVAEGSRRLVEAEAQARSEMASLQRDLQQSQAELNRQRDQLETERRQIATERYWDAIVGNAITAAAGLIACLLPLVLCWVLLRRPNQDCEANEALAEFLVQELASDHPALLPGHQSRPLLKQTPRCSGGLHIPGHSAPAATDAGGQDPLAAIRAVNALASGDGSALLILQNFHRFLQSPEIIQALIHQIMAGKQNRTFIVILSPLVQIPTELEKLFLVIEHQLPDREQLHQIARGIATEDDELPTGTELDTVLDAAAGLTRYEAEAAFSLSLVRHNRVTPEAVWELKAGMLKKSGLLSLYRGTEDFNSLGGLGSLKPFCKRSLLQPGRSNPLKRPRGVLLLGVPGTVKTAFAKSLGRETSRPTLVLDIGSLMGSLVGSTEANIRQALRIADAMSPCILFCDEVEKALSGVANSGQTDSGVSARLFGSLLTWMNDHTTDVYLVATCNDISKLPPEFSRAERFDGVFFLNLPDAEQRRAIWNLYLGQFELDPKQKLPQDDNWTGAETRACCRLSALLDVPLVQAAQNVVPVAVTATESVDRLRTWGQVGQVQFAATRRERAAAEKHEVIGIRMHVPSAGVVGKLGHGLVADERSTLEDQQRFIACPAGAGGHDPHVVKMVQRGPALGRLGWKRCVQPDQVQPRSGRRGHVGLIHLVGQPLGMAVPKLPGQIQNT